MAEGFLTEDEIVRLGEGNEAIFYRLENKILADIVRRIKKAGEITETADYQIMVLRDLGHSFESIRKMIQEALQESDEYTKKIFEEAAERIYTYNRPLYEGENQPFIPYHENIAVQNIVQAAFWESSGTMHNLTGTTGFVINQNFVELNKAFIMTWDNAVGAIRSGAFDYNTILKKTVSELTASGLRWVDYESGHHNRMTVAARRAIMTGLRQMVQGITNDVANRLGTEYFEVTAHANARPSHAKWQGKVYTKKQLYSVCGLGTGAGLCGWNCYHTFHPFVKDISVRAYTDEQLEEWYKTSTQPTIEWKGKKLTGYEGTQAMRKAETKMRAQRQRIYLLKYGEGSPEDLKAARIKYRVQMAEYKRLAATVGLPPMTERIYIDGLGRLA